LGHSSFSKRIGAKIVAAEPAEAVAVMMTCQDDIAKKRNNEIVTYHLSAKATAAKMLSKPPLSEKTKQDVIALTSSLSSITYSIWRWELVSL
jgi:hypothetical protein